jgi:hypothetical protein
LFEGTWDVVFVGGKGILLFLQSKVKQNNPNGHDWMVQLAAVAHEVVSSAKKVAQNIHILVDNKLMDMNARCS